MHVGDTIFIFCLALIIFGPKKLPEIGRQIGKLMVEFRRASNEFKMQIEEELRASEEVERQKEISATKTMLPNTAAPALEATVATNESGVSTAQVIAPPSTGVPVNHSFDPVNSTAGTCSYEAVASPLPEVSAYPEPENGFNPGLNTASNGAIAEDLVVESAPLPPPLPPPAVHPEASFQASTAESIGDLSGGLSGAVAEKTEAAVHHG